MNSGIKPDIAFIGGGNMASALIGGLLQAGRAPATVLVDRARRPPARQGWRCSSACCALAVADAQLADVPLVVWAVKPQAFAAAAAPVRAASSAGACS